MLFGNCRREGPWKVLGQKNEQTMILIDVERGKKIEEEEKDKQVQERDTSNNILYSLFKI